MFSSLLCFDIILKMSINKWTRKVILKNAFNLLQIVRFEKKRESERKRQRWKWYEFIPTFYVCRIQLGAHWSNLTWITKECHRINKWKSNPKPIKKHKQHCIIISYLLAWLLAFECKTRLIKILLHYSSRDTCKRLANGFTWRSTLWNHFNRDSSRFSQLFSKIWPNHQTNRDNHQSNNNTGKLPWGC